MAIDVSDTLGWFAVKDDDTSNGPRWRLRNNRLRAITRFHRETPEEIRAFAGNQHDNWKLWASFMSFYVDLVKQDGWALNPENLDPEAEKTLLRVFQGYYVTGQHSSALFVDSATRHAVELLARTYPEIWAKTVNRATPVQTEPVAPARPPFVADVKVQKPRVAQMGRVRRELDRVTGQPNGGTIFLQAEDATVLLKLLKKDKKRKAKRKKQDKAQVKAQRQRFVPPTDHE